MTCYIGLLRKDADSDYGVEFPDFPGAITSGRTLDEAREMAKEALQAHIEFMAEDNEILPEASSLENIMSKKSNKDAVAILVEVHDPYAIKRVNVTFREDILRQIDTYVSQAHLTRSSFLALAALEIMKQKHAKFS